MSQGSESSALRIRGGNILKASQLPVLIVGPKAAFAPTEKFVFRFITCAITLDEHGADVALYAKHLADEQGAELQVVFPSVLVRQAKK